MAWILGVLVILLVINAELLSSNQKTIAYQLKQKLGYWIDL